MKIEKPGIYRGVDAADYFADPAPEPSLSQSLCKVILDRSLEHASYAHPRLTPPDADDDEAEKYVKAQAIGNAAHLTMIGRGKKLEIIQANDFKGKEARLDRDAAVAAGLTPILQKHFDVASGVVESARRQLQHHEDRDAFQNGSGEVALVWQDDGIWCRSLVDWLHDDLRTVDDYKTSAMSMAPHVLGLRAQTAGWEIQAAFIERGLDILDPDGAGRRKFRFIAQEAGDKPYALSVMHMDEHWLTMGRKKIATAMMLWRRGIERGVWQGYPKRSIVPAYPGFKESQWLDREMSGEFEQDPSLIMAG